MSGDPNAVLQAAKNQLNDCDKKIGAIRAVLRSLGTGDDGPDEPNSLTIEWIVGATKVSKYVRGYTLARCTGS